MVEPIQLGVAGTGLISGIFARFAAIDGHYQLKSVVATSLAKANDFVEDLRNNPFLHDPREVASSASTSAVQQNAEKFSAGVETFSHFDQFLNSAIDTVYLGTPNALHYDQAKQALEAGKNVIVEKPAVTKDGQFEELVELAKRQNCLIVEALRHLWDPNFWLIKQELSLFDKVTGVSLAFRQFSSRYNAYKRGEVANVFRKDLDGGALFDLGVYAISALVALFGEPERVAYFPEYMAKPEHIDTFSAMLIGVDANGILILDYPSFRAVVQISKTQVSRQICEFYDDSGNVLSTDNIATLSWVRYNNKLLSNPILTKVRMTKVDLGSEILAFSQMIRGRRILEWTLEELHRISVGTHRTIARLIDSVDRS